MENVYFDTSTYDHLYKYKRHGISESDFTTLVSAAKTRKISVLPSITNVEETLGMLASRPDFAIAELRFILDLADRKKLLKPPHLLLSDDIKSYARSGLASEPFLQDPVIESCLHMLQTPTQKDKNEVSRVMEATQKSKETFKADMEEIRQKIQPEAKKLEGQCSDFDDCWERLADKVAEDFAERVGVLDACRKRGIEGLLELRSMRLAVGVNLSLMYAMIFEKRTSHLGDSRDIHHAILASAADEFVTQDTGLRRLLSRIRIENFRVKSLNDFFKLIC